MKISMTHADEKALTEKVAEVTGRRHCGHCWSMRPVDGGVTRLDARGKPKWTCASCNAKRKPR